MSALANYLQGLGRAQFFLFTLLAGIPHVLARPRLLAQQLYSVGVLSLVIIVLSGSFVGMVLALQFYRTLQVFGAGESLGVAIALSVVREFGPVVTALLFAGRAGSALAAEIGLMKATDQLSGMEMMAVDPVQRVVAPRFLAGLIAMPLLAFIFTVMAIGVAGAKLPTLELICHEKMRPRMLAGLKFSEFFRWLSSTIADVAKGQNINDAMKKHSDDAWDGGFKI